MIINNRTVRRSHHTESSNNGNGKIYFKGVTAKDVLLDYEIINPQWTEVATLLQGIGECTKSKLRFCDVPLTEAISDELLPALSEVKNVNELRIEFESMGEQGLRFLSMFVSNMPSLTSLVLEGEVVICNALDCSCDWIGPINDFSRALAQSSIEHLHFKDCRLLEKDRYLSSILTATSNKKMNFVFEDNYLPSVSIGVISRYIASNPLTESLLLHTSNNKLRKHDEKNFIKGLKHNTNLKQFELRDEYLHYNKGRKHPFLVKAVADPSSLNAIADSNHTCQILNLGSLCIKPFRNDHSPAENKRKKILRAFRFPPTGKWQLSYFDDVPVKLMPEVLALVQEDRKESKENIFTKVFEVMRGWKLPLLYEFQKTGAA